MDFGFSIFIYIIRFIVINNFNYLKFSWDYKIKRDIFCY